MYKKKPEDANSLGSAEAKKPVGMPQTPGAPGSIGADLKRQWAEALAQVDEDNGRALLAVRYRMCGVPPLDRTASEADITFISRNSGNLRMLRSEKYVGLRESLLPALRIPYSGQGLALPGRIRLCGDLPGGKDKYRSARDGGAHLYVPPATQRAWDKDESAVLSLLVVEGEFKALAALHRAIDCESALGLKCLVVGVPGITAVRGKDKKLFPQLRQAIEEGREIIVVPDGDAIHNLNVAKPTRALIMEISRLQLDAGLPVRVKHWPLPSWRAPDGEKIKAGLDDYLIEFESWQEADAEFNRCLAGEGPYGIRPYPLTAEEQAELALPTVNLSLDDHVIVDKLRTELAKHTDVFLCQAGRLVRIGIDDLGLPRAFPWAPATFRTSIGKYVRLQDAKKNGPLENTQRCTEHISSSLYQQADWAGRLFGVAAAPRIRQDGSLLRTPGYDQASGLYLACDLEDTEVSEMGADEAKEALADVFVDFFPSTSRKLFVSCCIAFLLTVVARRAVGGAGYLDPAPGFLINAQRGGAGKNLLCDMLCLIAARRGGAIAPLPGEEKEQWSSLTTVLCRAAPIVRFDNIKHKVEGAAYESYLTAGRDGWSNRLLGGNTEGIFSSFSVLLFNGNRAGVGPEVQRRLVVMDIDKYTGDKRKRDEAGLRAWVEEHRLHLLGAVWSLWKTWHEDAGYCLVDDGIASGSFATWGATVQRCLLWHGYPDPFESQTKSRVEHEDTAGAMLWAVVLAALLAAEGKRLSTQDLFKTVRADAELTKAVWPNYDPSVKTLGDALGKLEGDRVWQLTTCRIGTENARGWRLISLNDLPQENSLR